MEKFKGKEKFTELVNELGIHKNTIPKLLKSSIGLGFFKNYHKDIKAICKEYEKDFQC